MAEPIEGKSELVVHPFDNRFGSALGLRIDDYPWILHEPGLEFDYRIIRTMGTDGTLLHYLSLWESICTFRLNVYVMRPG